MWNRGIVLAIQQVRRISSASIYRQNNVNQVHVNKFCRILIKTSCPLTIRPFDSIACPDENKVRATLAKNQTEVDVSVDSLQDDQGHQTVHVNEKLTKFIGHDEILLEVPVTADLYIENGESVTLSDFQSDAIRVRSLGAIRSRNIKAETISLHGGEVKCLGTTLAKELVVQSDLDGEIHLDKVLGDHLTVQSDEGCITVNSSYSNFSSFTTKTGNMNLKNVHRNCEINVEESSDLTMSGFQGNLLITMNKGSMDLQIAELEGESVILADKSTDIDLKLGEDAVNSTYVHVAVPAENLHLAEELEPARGTKQNGASTLNLISLDSKLFIQTDGKVRIKQLSWAESFFSGKDKPE